MVILQRLYQGKMVSLGLRVVRSHYLHKKRKISAVPLDVAPERRTEQHSPRFRPGARFCNQASDTCRQAVRERNVGP